MKNDVQSGYKVELYRQFLFHYANWVEFWMIENPIGAFTDTDEYTKAFYTENKVKLQFFRVKYQLKEEDVQIYMS